MTTSTVTPIRPLSNPFEGTLKDARNHLIWMRARLANWRRMPLYNSNDREMFAEVEREFLEALDRVWQVQSWHAQFAVKSADCYSRVRNSMMAEGGAR